MNALTPLQIAFPPVLAPHPDTPVHAVLQQALSLATLARTVALLVREASPLPVDMTQRQLALLLHLATMEGPHTVRGLADALRLSKPAICRAVDVLSEAALVERKPDLRDRRSVLLALTSTGRGAVHALAYQLSTPNEA
ncbi:MarR family winged helix-turn-helix transcriptional regulator [Teichococcus aestuarii]|uniref:MarR family winged helix-turn-helix transcriptional regulator n=1 Tax=Teichococcus aestuarii TaxID=568898 RepID=UPI00360AA154